MSNKLDERNECTGPETVQENETLLAPDKLENMIAVVEIKSWVAFATVLIILAATVVWGFWGTMQLRVEATGALVKSGKIINIYSSEDSVLRDFSLAPEEYVVKDQIVARLELQEQVNEVNLMIAQGADPLEIKAKQDELLDRSQIVVNESGRIVDVYVRAGDYVGKGTKLATISKEAEDGKALECLLYVPAEKIKGIKKGLKVNVFPASVSKKNYGNMIGTVASVSEYPVTYQYLFDTLGSEELATEFLKNGACYEVYLNLVASEDTETGYKWTTSLGPKKKFGNLTLCDAAIIIEELRPIDVFFFD